MYNCNDIIPSSRTDLPRYIVYSRGKRVDDTLDLSGFGQGWKELVSFYLGCSFTFESALLAAGIELTHVRQNKNTSMYLTNIPLQPAGAFGGHMITSMRPIKRTQLAKMFDLTARYPDAHGAPIHIGDPARIGVPDIFAPFAGSGPTFLEDEDEVPVFWACGFSVSQILTNVGEFCLCVLNCLCT